MSWLGKALGGGIVEPLAGAGADVVESVEETKRWKHRAAAIVEVASATWRPWIARLLGLSIVVHVAGSTLLLHLMALGEMFGASWSLLATWALWMAYGRELFDLTKVLLGLYIGSRGVEKVAPAVGGPVGAVLGRAASAVTGRPPVTTTAPDERTPPAPVPSDARVHEPPFMRPDR